MFKHFDDHICKFKVQIDEFRLKIYELKCKLFTSNLQKQAELWRPQYINNYSHFTQLHLTNI
jgi:hypothetical protein